MKDRMRHPENQSLRLKGRRGLVTGAGRGIGREMCRLLTLEGADLAIVARGREGLDGTVAACQPTERRILPFPADVTRPQEIEAAVASAWEQLGGIDFLVNNAGVGFYKPFLELTQEDWRGMLEVNVLGTVWTCQSMLPRMTANGGGDIVNINSQRGLATIETAAGYCASKYALTGLTEVMGKEFAGKNVRVMSLHPGGVLTDFGGTSSTQKNQQFLDPVDIAEVLVEMLASNSRMLMRQVVVVPRMLPG